MGEGSRRWRKPSATPACCRSCRRAPVESPSILQPRVGQGLEGDRHRGAGRRQVTLLQAEHLDVIAALLGHAAGTVEAEALRRNLVIRGINLLALRQACFRVGAALLEGTGTCDPCSRMEEVLGAGGFNAMRGHGGITARVLEGGPIELGAEVRLVSAGLAARP